MLTRIHRAVYFAVIAFGIALPGVTHADFPFTQDTTQNGIVVKSSVSPDFISGDRITHVRKPGTLNHVNVSTWNGLVSQANQLKNNLNQIDVYRIRQGHGQFVTVTAVPPATASTTLPFTVKPNATAYPSITVATSTTPDLATDDQIMAIRSTTNPNVVEEIGSWNDLQAKVSRFKDSNQQIQLFRLRGLEWVTVTVATAAQTKLAVANYLNRGQTIHVQKMVGNGWQYKCVVHPRNWNGPEQKVLFDAQPGETWGLFVQEYKYGQLQYTEIKRIHIGRLNLYEMIAYVTDLPVHLARN